MRLQIIYKNKGFLIFEAMVSFMLLTLFLVSTVTLSGTMQSLREKAVRGLLSLPIHISEIEDFITKADFRIDSKYFKSFFGNYTNVFNIGPFSLLRSDYSSAFGRDSCYPRLDFYNSKLKFYESNVDLGTGNLSTDIEARNGFVYMTSDGSTSSLPDLYIIDATNTENIKIISSLDTGPGLTSLEVVGRYIYALNSGTTNSLQIIDIIDRNHPTLVSKFKLPTPNASTSPPIGSSIFYSRGKVYIGTEKWSGAEFFVLDVSDLLRPNVIGSFETDTQVEDIYIRNNYAYVATPSTKQFRVLEISNPSRIVELTSFSPSGYQTQEGKVISFFENNLFFGRTVGGFNVIQNHEMFSFATSTYPFIESPFTLEYSKDIPGGVYGILFRDPYLFLATGSMGHEFQVWDRYMSKKIADIALPFFPRSFSCDGSDLYFVTHDSKGLYIIKNI